MSRIDPTSEKSTIGGCLVRGRSVTVEPSNNFAVFGAGADCSLFAVGLWLKSVELGTLGGEFWIVTC